MIGHLGVIQYLRQANLQMDEDSLFQIFEKMPTLRRSCWEIWQAKLSISAEYYPKS